jgi:hypothetical protein
MAATQSQGIGIDLLQQFLSNQGQKQNGPPDFQGMLAQTQAAEAEKTRRGLDAFATQGKRMRHTGINGSAIDPMTGMQHMSGMDQFYAKNPHLRPGESSAASEQRRQAGFAHEQEMTELRRQQEVAQAQGGTDMLNLFLQQQGINPSGYQVSSAPAVNNQPVQQPAQTGNQPVQQPSNQPPARTFPTGPALAQARVDAAEPVRKRRLDSMSMTSNVGQSASELQMHEQLRQANGKPNLSPSLQLIFKYPELYGAGQLTEEQLNSIFAPAHETTAGRSGWEELTPEPARAGRSGWGEPEPALPVPAPPGRASPAGRSGWGAPTSAPPGRANFRPTLPAPGRAPAGYGSTPLPDEDVMDLFKLLLGQ